MGRKCVGKPPLQWSDDIRKLVENHCHRDVQDRYEWKRKGDKGPIWIDRRLKNKLKITCRPSLRWRRRKRKNVVNEVRFSYMDFYISYEIKVTPSITAFKDLQLLHWFTASNITGRWSSCFEHHSLSGHILYLLRTTSFVILSFLYY